MISAFGVVHIAKDVRCLGNCTHILGVTRAFARPGTKLSVDHPAVKAALLHGHSYDEVLSGTERAADLRTRIAVRRARDLLPRIKAEQRGVKLELKRRERVTKGASMISAFGVEYISKAWSSQ